ncbi:MAG TPA: AraC family transcriptional regulator [Chitinophagaceae bacterium]|nr:AraC family transcriptional regulator [Chitinophagaceae bacterium]
MDNLDEIIHTVNSMYTTRETKMLMLKDEKHGLIRLNTAAEKWYTVLSGTFSNVSHDLHFTAGRTTPFVMMYFQLKGTSTFHTSSHIRLRDQMHSLNYLPAFKFKTRIGKNTVEEFFCVKIFPDLLLQHMSDQDGNNPLANFCKRNDPFVTLETPQVIKPVIHQSIHDYLNCPYGGTLGAAYKDNIILNLFIHQLAAFTETEHEAGNTGTSLSKADIDLLNDIKTYLDQHYLEVGSLKQLTRKFYINSFKLKHGFKQLFSNSVMRYVDEHKMNYARTMLQQGRAELTDVADELGYKHYNNFSTAFKKRFGYSPVALQ